MHERPSAVARAGGGLASATLCAVTPQRLAIARPTPASLALLVVGLVELAAARARRQPRRA